VHCVSSLKADMVSNVQDISWGKNVGQKWGDCKSTQTTMYIWTSPQKKREIRKRRRARQEECSAVLRNLMRPEVALSQSFPSEDTWLWYVGLARWIIGRTQRVGCGSRCPGSEGCRAELTPGQDQWVYCMACTIWESATCPCCSVWAGPPGDLLS
jgi:hypothetical protein